MAKPSGYYNGVVDESDHNALSEDQMARVYRPGMRVPWVVVTTLITALASVIGTYYATHATPVDCASKGDLNAVDKHVSELARSVDLLTVTMNRNADQASGEVRNLGTRLQSYIDNHAK
jgi:hypothetical protein